MKHGYLGKTTKLFKIFFSWKLMKDQQISTSKRKTKAYFSFRPFPNWVILRNGSNSWRKEWLQYTVISLYWLISQVYGSVISIFKMQIKQFCQHLFFPVKHFTYSQHCLWSSNRAWIYSNTTPKTVCFTLWLAMSKIKIHSMGHMDKIKPVRTAGIWHFYLISFSSPVYNSICLGIRSTVRHKKT